MTEQKENKIKMVELNVDPNLKTIWVDNIYIAKRSDGVSLIRLSTSLPEGLFEQVRFITSDKALKNIVDIICSNIDYYPNKNKQE